MKGYPINHWFIQVMLKNPNIEGPKITIIVLNDNELTSWMTPIARYIEKGRFSSDPLEESLIKRRASSYFLIKEMLKCLKREEVVHTLAKVHEIIVRQHLGAWALAKKVLSVGQVISSIKGPRRPSVIDKCI